MTGLDIVSFAATVAALVLAVVAIWLSIVFYRMSSALSENTKEAAKGIGSSVERLEKLFDKLYADTFSMMRDTVSDMRKHIWPENTPVEKKVATEVEQRADAKVEAVRAETERQLSVLLKRQDIANERIEGLRAEISQVIGDAIARSRQVESEAREETFREILLSTLGKMGARTKDVMASDVLNALPSPYRGDVGSMVVELQRLKKDGLVALDEDPIGPGTKILLNH